MTTIADYYRDRVNAEWPKDVPPMTGAEADRSARRLYRFVFQAALSVPGPRLERQSVQLRSRPRSPGQPGPRLAGACPRPLALVLSPAPPGRQAARPAAWRA